MAIKLCNKKIVIAHLIQAIEVASRQPKMISTYKGKPSPNLFADPLPVESNFLFGEYSVLKSQYEIAKADKVGNSLVVWL